MKEVLDALKYLYTNGIINDIQFQDFYNRCNTPGFDLSFIKTELKEIYDKYYDFEIKEVDDGDLSNYTGVYSISKIMENIESKNNNIENSITDNFNGYEEIGEGNSLGSSKSVQKTIGAHPGVGSHFHFSDDGFTNLLLIVFLTGISVGIVSMIVLNFIA